VGGAGQQEGGGDVEDDALHAALREMGLIQYEKRLRDMGVESLDDFQYLDEPAVKAVGAKTIHAKKLILLARKHGAQI